MPAVNDVGEPCAGEPHARFEGRGLETEQQTGPGTLGRDNRPGNRRHEGPGPTARSSHRASPRPNMGSRHSDCRYQCPPGLRRTLESRTGP